MADKPLKSLTFPDLTDTYTIPQKPSDLTNDSGFVNASGAASAAPVQSVNGQTGDVDVNTVYIGSSAPTDPNVNVWVDTAGSSDIVVPLPASTAPLMDGTAAIGTATTYARADHVHPTDTSKADKVTEVTNSTAGAVSVALDPEKIYHFTGALTSLSITLTAPANGHLAYYHFDFDSGSTAPTLTLPQTVTMPSGFTVEANKHYEIDILNNYGVVTAW